MKYILFPFMMLLLLCVKNDVHAQNSYSVVTPGKEKHTSPVASSAFIAYFDGAIKNDRVILNWTVNKNKEADRFELERSSDGKNFVLAALIFGTDEPDKAEYQFYEKLKKVKSFYRLKIINKDNTVDYSTILSP